MGGITLWIILGVLVGAVIIFLVVASILDRRKQKKLQAELEVHNEAVQKSSGEVAIFINELVERNNKLLEEFVPSVGELKMSDIRSKAREALKDLKHSEEFSLISNEPEAIFYIEEVETKVEEEPKEEKKKLFGKRKKVEEPEIDESSMVRNSDVLQYIENLWSTNSNLWAKKADKEVEFFKEQSNYFVNDEEYADYTKSVEERLNNIYA